jgi:2-keto-3-deoxy-L-rhamnonate aldolase RhmA
VPGLDGVFVGPSDLAISIGRSPGEQSDELASLIERVGDACAAAGIAAGIYAGESASAQRWAAEGYRLVALHNDARLLLDAAREQLALTRRS